jgi:hypothetical protein
VRRFAAAEVIAERLRKNWLPETGSGRRRARVLAFRGARHISRGGMLSLSAPNSLTARNREWEDR